MFLSVTIDVTTFRDEKNTPHKTQQAHFVVRKIAVSIKFHSAVAYPRVAVCLWFKENRVANCKSLKQ